MTHVSANSRLRSIERITSFIALFPSE